MTILYDHIIHVNKKNKSNDSIMHLKVVNSVTYTNLMYFLVMYTYICTNIYNKYLYRYIYTQSTHHIQI